MAASAYIETSVVSYLTGRPARDVIIAGRQALTAEWWDTCRARFDLYVSALVVEEAGDGDPEAVRRRLAAIEGIPAVTVGDEARELARLLIDAGPMPAEYPEDALHIAVCAFSGIDYLVTWNCTHLANASIRREVERIPGAVRLPMSGHLHAGRIDGGMSMFKDPFVEEVRAAGKEHAAKFNNDLDAIVADLKDREKKLDRPVVSLTPKRPVRKAS